MFEPRLHFLFKSFLSEHSFQLPLSHLIPAGVSIQRALQNRLHVFLHLSAFTFITECHCRVPHYELCMKVSSYVILYPYISFQIIISSVS